MMNPLYAVTAQADLPQYFVGWGTLSLINAGLAQSKGHSGMAWWFISMLLGPVATFIIVVFLQPPSEPPGSSNVPTQGHPGKPVIDPDVYDDLA